jgi:hypothetical protein
MATEAQENQALPLASSEMSHEETAERAQVAMQGRGRG